MAKSWFYTGGGLARMALDACFPPLCASCDAPVDAAGNLCGQCYPQLRQIARPHCSHCGVPFALPVDEALCALCASELPPYAKARSVWVYNEVSRALVGRLKFADRTHMLPRYGAALAQAGSEMLGDADVVMPVPLHWRRLMWRRYNQSALLAYAMVRRTGHKVDVRSLRRIRHTVPQTTLKGEERRKNVKGAFAVKDVVRDKVVVLVDDVMTTGATIHACTETLKKAGAKEVRVLTLARTLKD